MSSDLRILVSNKISRVDQSLDYWCEIPLRTKTIADLKAVLAANDRLSAKDVDLFLRGGRLRDETNICIVRDEDVIAIQPKTTPVSDQRSSLCHQLNTSSASVGTNTAESFPPEVMITYIQEFSVDEMDTSSASSTSSSTTLVSTPKSVKRRSKRRVFGSKGRKTYRCNEENCDRSYYTRNNLLRHIRLNHSLSLVSYHRFNHN
ncbi:unnamed protein product [Medioppia subpectinata]|uniref:C2H2-type domain-containing protein n=1 Tax=Medioppia subpectinata TaxID=1979941 RepID=A0A7R9LFD6_9ACAR|nr:unnamed protein product [Medioppia subpectinata]CAG2118372.1 unnamed protein product [Medioppia subpectinata]